MNPPVASQGPARSDESRRAEEQMRSVVDHVLDGIITIDEQGRIDSFNPAAEKLFGYTRDEVLGANVRMLMPEPYHSEHDGYLQNYMRTGHAKIIGVGREVVGRRKDGSTFPMELAVSEFRIGAQRYFTGIVRDITERKALEHELRRRVEDLAEADRQKNDFLAMLAHELRNPLAPIRNALHLMSSPGVDDDMIDRARSVMERQVHQMVRLVDDLLDISRIIRGKIELRKEKLDVAAAIERAVETVQPMIDAQQHTLEVSLPPAPLFVEADLIRLSQIIGNLLTNAAKYSEPGSRIWLEVKRDGGYAAILVRDSGIGIAPEMKAKIFDLFVQGDRSLARSQGGLGIGLTLVKRLVQLHAGSVSVRSAGIGTGSEFVVCLPALPDSAVHAAAPAAAAAAGAHAVRGRVLVVDDNVDAADSIAMILTLSGYETRCVYDGHAVLEVAREFDPAIVVLDIGLPGMSGYDVARAFRREPRFRSTPLVAVTGYGQEEDRRRSAEAGFDRHLTKPVDPKALLSFLEDALT